MVELNKMRHTIVRAGKRDLVVLFVDSKVSAYQMEIVEKFAEEVAEETEAILAIFPDNVMTEAKNYTLQDLLKLRSVVDDLISDRVESFPVVEV